MVEVSAGSKNEDVRGWCVVQIGKLVLIGRTAILRENTPRIRGNQAVGRNLQEKSRLNRIKYLSDDHEVQKYKKRKQLARGI